MKKTLLYFIFGMLAFCFQIEAQVIATLGNQTGSSSTNSLLSTSTTVNRYSRTMSLYTASEIITAGGLSGTISSLAWSKAGVGEYPFGDAYIKVYIKHVTHSTWASVPSWTTEVEGATEVFTSSTYSIPPGTGWKEVPFTTPFEWNGTSNIVIYVEWYRPSTPTGDIAWGRSTDATMNATRVGSTSLDALVMLINSSRPLVQLTITPNTANLDDAIRSTFQLYPNPTTDILFYSSEQPLTNYVLYTANGQIIKEADFTATEGQINVAGLTSGLYYIKIISADKSEVLKWVKL